MKQKREQITCTCGAYPFPHRFKGGACFGVLRPQHQEEYEPEWEKDPSIARGGHFTLRADGKIVED